MSWNDLRKGRYSQAQGEYFVTFSCYQRQPIFSQYAAAQLFCQSLKINQQTTGSLWLEWVLMPDHFHGLLQLGGQCDLAAVIKDLKGRSALLLNKQLTLKGKRWQPNYFDRGLRCDEDRRAIARYIVANPMRAGLVRKIGDYPYWNSVYF